MNDGPLCRCSAKARRAGIRHGIYVGEDHLPLCDPFSNNADRLFHYRITMTPHTNFLVSINCTITMCHFLSSIFLHSNVTISNHCFHIYEKICTIWLK